MRNENSLCFNNTLQSHKPLKSIKDEVPKLKILPVPIKPTFNTNMSSLTNQMLINNCKYYYNKSLYVDVIIHDIVDWHVNFIISLHLGAENNIF